MKKLLVFAVVVGGLATMTSCKKDYTCTYDDGTVTTYEKMLVNLVVVLGLLSNPY